MLGAETVNPIETFLYNVNCRLEQSAPPTFLMQWQLHEFQWMRPDWWDGECIYVTGKSVLHL
jgi:hypothetical protein